MKKAAFLALLVMVWFVSPVRAVEPGKTTDRVKPLASAAKAIRCELSESKLNFRTNLYEQNRDKHTSIYNGVRKRLGDLVAKYERQGCEMTTVKTDLQKFDILISDFGASYRDFDGSMLATRSYSCNDTQGNLPKALQTSRQKITVVRQRAAAVHEFFKSTIQPHLSQKIKACQPSPKPAQKLKASPSSSSAVSDR